jgi:hypothetical protein
MSQKSSVPQAVSSVSQVLKRDTADDATNAVPGTYTVTSSADQTIDALKILDKRATLYINGASSFSTINGGQQRDDHR